MLPNPTVHHPTRKCPPPILIMSQIFPIHISKSHFSKFHYIIT